MKKIDFTLIGLLILIMIPVNSFIYAKFDPYYPSYNSMNDGLYFNTYLTIDNFPDRHLSENNAYLVKIRKTTFDSFNSDMDSAVSHDAFHYELNNYEEAIMNNDLVEENLELEQWMMDYEWIKIEKFEEEEIKMEGWMTNPQKWEKTKFSTL